MAAIVDVVKLFDQTIAAGATAVSAGWRIESADALALHLTSITGTSPDVTFTYALSVDGVTYTTPQTPVSIGANKGAADVMDFAPEAAKWIRITATNNNGANSVTIVAYLAQQER